MKQLSNKQLNKNKPSQHNQQGFIILMGMLMLVLGASVWFGTLGTLKSTNLKLEREAKAQEQLYKIKQRMLQFAALHPEIYGDATFEPGPGYFPCPDLTGDGSMAGSCGTLGGVDQLFVYGMVPYKIGTRNFTFLDSEFDNRLYWFAVDARYVYRSGQYTSYSSSNWRFAELNTELPREVSPASGPDVVPLTLNNREQIVMVLFYADLPLSHQVRPLSNDSSYAVDNVNEYLEQTDIVAGIFNNIVQGAPLDFVSTGGVDVFNDQVIAITKREWAAAVMTRVARDSDSDGNPDLCTAVADTDIHWFNDCVYNSSANGPSYSCTLDTSAASDNLAGQGWRGIVCN